LTKRRLGSVLAIAFTLIGTHIGAGFATGQEIVNFFSRYGVIAPITTILAALGLGAIMLATAFFCTRARVFHFEALMGKLGAAGQVWRYSVLAGCFGSLIVMLAGVGAVCGPTGSTFNRLGVVLGGVVAFYFGRRNIEGLTRINVLLIPFFCLVMLGLGILLGPNLLVVRVPVSGWQVWPGLLGACLYVAYNCGTLLAVVPGLCEAQGLRNTAAGIALATTAIAVLSMLMAIMLVALPVPPGWLPLTFLVEKALPGLSRLISFPLLCAIITTAVADLYTLVDTAQSKGYSGPRSAAVIVLICIAIAQLGFARLVGIIYPLYAWLMLGGLVLLPWRWIARTR
jgi:uncharacterized membrane protein YkvI